VKSLNYFAVPKGEDDIRVVFDGTASGLNDALWANWFSLPKLDSMLQHVGEGIEQDGLDCGFIAIGDNSNVNRLAKERLALPSHH
jgi:hypothetical protein